MCNMPETVRTTELEKNRVIHTCMHAPTVMHMKNVFTLLQFSSTNSQGDITCWFACMILFGTGLICLGCFVYFPMRTSKKKNQKDHFTKEVKLLRTGAAQKTGLLMFHLRRECRRTSSEGKTWKPQEETQSPDVSYPCLS